MLAAPAKKLADVRENWEQRCEVRVPRFLYAALDTILL